MKSITSIILLVGLIAICCNPESNKTAKQENKPTNNEKSSFKEKEYLISDKGVLGLFIGDSLPNRLDNYILARSVKTVEEGNQEPIVNLIDNSEILLQISFDYDQRNGRFNNKIGEILIKSKRFRTEENIGVGSTIGDFINSYPNYYMWYSYISGNYVIQSKGKEIQFILDGDGYTGKVNLMGSDMVELTKEDFSQNTIVIAIRVF